ncbi:MAG: formate dehydrogenase accessory protein FdhE [Thermomicrobiales bacterium]
MAVGVSDGTRRQLDALHKSHPEWQLLLALWEQVFHEDARTTWSAVSATIDPARPPSSPLLADATIRLSPLAVTDWLRRLLTQITKDYQGQIALTADLANRLDPVGLLEAAISQDEQLISLLANQAGVDPAALDALAQIMAAPTLLACARDLAVSVPPDWNEGFCPICGAWATITEQRGLERSRRLRCGRCGGDWMGVDLRCPYCKTIDHNSLSSLVPDGAGGSRKVETCRECMGYMKVMAALRPWSPNEVVLADLSTVELDFVAVDRGFSRPERLATSFRIAIEATGS